MAVDFYRDINPMEKFSMPAVIRPKVTESRDDHLNLFGKVDEAAVRQQEYEAAKQKYPDPKTCTDLAGEINAINSEIQSLYAQKANDTASGGSGRPQARSIDGYTQRMNELTALSQQWQCQQYADQQAHQQYLNDLNNELQSASQLSTQDTTSTYLIYGGIGLVALVSLLLIFR